MVPSDGSTEWKCFFYYFRISLKFMFYMLAFNYASMIETCYLTLDMSSVGFLFEWKLVTATTFFLIILSRLLFRMLCVYHSTASDLEYSTLTIGYCLTEYNMSFLIVLVCCGKHVKEIRWIFYKPKPSLHKTIINLDIYVVMVMHNVFAYEVAASIFMGHTNRLYDNIVCFKVCRLHFQNQNAILNFYA